MGISVVVVCLMVGYCSGTVVFSIDSDSSVFLFVIQEGCSTYLWSFLGNFVVQFCVFVVNITF